MISDEERVGRKLVSIIDLLIMRPDAGSKVCTIEQGKVNKERHCHKGCRLDIDLKLIRQNTAGCPELPLSLRRLQNCSIRYAAMKAYFFFLLDWPFLELAGQ